ncbi:MAG: non-canonical purine NTP pyrophosphatase [Candidatus Eremiobacteraeota bacterium]|nr:non-canonical purine NTP pyrophosphatase [Candidatus Eremiobacteraeota bacterium]
MAVATRNPDKFAEIVQLWGDAPPALVIAGPEYPDVDERFSTYEENAVLKASELARIRGGPALADDSGIEVEALGWAPGVLSARTPSPDSSPSERNELILGQFAALGNVSRRARYVCVCALVVPGHEPVIGRGEVEGEIALGPRGSGGFGYDPIFCYPPYGRTFGEVDIGLKHAVSHRGRAIRALRKKLTLRS